MRPSLPVILLFLFLMLCLAAAYFLTGSLQRTSKASQQHPQAAEPPPANTTPADDRTPLPPAGR
jgi:hypothetical protein